MKIGVLTSSRADYGIYQPLLRKMKADKSFELEIIAFGMHLQTIQGNTLEAIYKDGYKKVHEVGTMPEEDSVYDIASSYGYLVSDFARFWNIHTFDLIFALGDRWEMSAAVQSSIPFEIKLVHFYGGETTLGAIDDVFRHQITLASQLHFTATDRYARRVAELKGDKKNIFSVGSMSLENFENLCLPMWSKVKVLFQIPFDSFILVTFHPESIGTEKNLEFSNTVFNTLKQLTSKYNLLITAANSDAMGSIFNKKHLELEKLYPTRVRLVQALGKLNYFSAIQNCQFMVGNTSSGIVEAASFNKWVVNVGERQKGRLKNKNVFDVPFDEGEILKALDFISVKTKYDGTNIYYNKNSVSKILKEIKALIIS